LIFWAMIAVEASFGSFFALWPLWIEETGAPVTLVGLLLGLGGIIRLFVLLPSAWLARRFGLKHAMMWARGIAALGIASAALAQDWTWLFPALIGMAIGDLAFPLVSTFISANAGDQRVRAFAIILTTGPSISLMVTPLISGLLVDLWGLRAPFVMAGIFSAISVYFFGKLRDVERPASDEEPHGGYLGILRLTGLPLLLTLQFLTFFAIGMGTSLLSIYLHEQKGLAESIIPPLTSATAVGSIVGSVIVARSRRLSNAPLKAVAGAVALTASAYFVFLNAGALALVIVAMTLRGGFFVAWPLFSAVLGEATPERMRAHVFALGEILAGTGFVVAPVLAGQLYDVRPELPLIAAIGMLLPLAVILGILRQPRSGAAPLVEDAAPAI
jgi:MFS family permease